MAGGLYWPAGFKCRLDTAMFFDRSRFCYEDETPTDQHHIRVFKTSPRKVRMSQAEQQGGSSCWRLFRQHVFPGPAEKPTRKFGPTYQI